MEYSRLSINAIKKIGEHAIADGEQAAFSWAIDTYGPWILDWISPIIRASINGTIDFTEREYYRIGEPIATPADCYSPSFNFADQHFEHGVSVVSIGWLHSLKSVFFNAETRCKTRGVWKITGISLTVGGDDEPVIYPTSWAVKTKIRSVSGLERAVSEMDAQHV